MKFHAANVSASLNKIASAALNDILSTSLFNDDMTNDEVRRTNLSALIELAGGVGKFAAVLGVSGSQVSQWKNASPDSRTGKPRAMQDATARRIENVFDRPRGWMDQAHGDAPPAAIASDLQSEDRAQRHNLDITEDEAALLRDLRELLPKSRERYTEWIGREADEARAYRAMKDERRGEATAADLNAQRIIAALRAPRSTETDGGPMATRTTDGNIGVRPGTLRSFFEPQATAKKSRGRK